MASKLAIAFVVILAISAAVLMAVGIWGYMTTAASVSQNPALAKLVPSLQSYRAIVWRASGSQFEKLASELNATTSIGSSPIRVEIVDLCSYAESPYIPKSGEGVLAIDTGKCSVDTYALTYYLVKKLWSGMNAGLELRMPTPKAIAVLNTGKNVVVAAFSSQPTRSAALLLQLALSLPTEPKPQIVVIDVGNESSRASAIGLEEVSRGTYVLSNDLYMVTTVSLVSVSSGSIDVRCVGPLDVSSYAPSTVATSGGLFVEKKSFGNVLLLGIRKVLDRSDLSKGLVSLYVEPSYSAMAWAIHSYAVLSLKGGEGRALLSLDSFGATTLATIVFSR